MHQSPSAEAPMSTVLAPRIEGRIQVIRGLRVIIDMDLAVLYGVPTKRLNEQVRRNAKRFPADFLIRLTKHDLTNLRSQSATSSWGGRRYAPLAFTEHGAIMVATILDSPRAVQMSVYVVRAFARLRQAVAVLDADTRRQFDQVYEAILGLMATSPRQQ